jgi:hypothetical protein
MEKFDALMAEMTRAGVLIVTRDSGTYTVYWARRHGDLLLQPNADALKRSYEGTGATVLEAILDCKEQAAAAVSPANVIKANATPTETPAAPTTDPSPPVEGLSGSL